MAGRSLPRQILRSVLGGLITLTLIAAIETRWPAGPTRDTVMNVLSAPPLLLTRAIYGVQNVGAPPPSTAVGGATPAAVPEEWGLTFDVMGFIFYFTLWWVVFSLVHWVKFGE